MSRRTRRKGLLGRHLPTMPAAPFLQLLPVGFKAFGEGLEPPKTTRPYVTRAGRVNLELTFRDREGGRTVVMKFPLLGPLPADVLAALKGAIGPTSRVVDAAT